MKIHRLIRFSIAHILTMFLVGVLLTGCATNYANRTQVQQFIQQMADKHQFDKTQLTALFSQIKPNHSIIKAMNKPHESFPWYRYRPIFVTNKRAHEGAEFWRAHANTLNYAQQHYGVPAPIIVAIIGVETRYGYNEGNKKTLDALATLAFDYPPREHYFQSELEQYLLLTRENSLDPRTVLGSYAGALGLPQFMPSSYRQYAVDYSGKGSSNLFTNADDAIVSVANYFQQHGWQPGAPIAARAWVSGDDYLSLSHAVKPTYTIAELADNDVHTHMPLAPQELAAFIPLQAYAGPEYWLGLHNFYVITRYNSSAMYAMAVYQLSEGIRYYYNNAQQN